MRHVPTAGWLIVTLIAVPAPARAQGAFTHTIKQNWDTIKFYIRESAKTMPEADYAFRPIETVRTFGQIIGHLINDHYAVCAQTKGERNPNTRNFEQARTKAELMTALDASIVYCDAVFATTEARAAEPITLYGTRARRFDGLVMNLTHDNEHYGNLVTYLRLRGQVPPSSRRP